MFIVRKKLSALELNPTQTTYDPDCDCVKQNVGGTLVDAPALDTRTSLMWQKPPVSAGDPKCQAALNYVAQLQGFFTDVLGVLNIATAAWTGVSIILDAITIAFPPGAPVDALALLALNAADGILGAGVTAVNSAFDSAAYDAIKCAYDCSASTDGSISPAGLTAMLALVATTPGGLVSTILNLITDLQGNVGVSNWGATGMASGDCADCECTCEGQFGILGGDGFPSPWEINCGGSASTCAPCDCTYDSGADKLVGCQSVVDFSAMYAGGINPDDLGMVGSFSMTYTAHDGRGTGSGIEIYGLTGGVTLLYTHTLTDGDNLTFGDTFAGAGLDLNNFLFRVTTGSNALTGTLELLNVRFCPAP